MVQVVFIRETALRKELARSPSSYVPKGYEKTPIQETREYAPTTQEVFKDTQIPKSTFDSEHILKKTFPQHKKETIQPSNQTSNQTSKFTPDAMISAAKLIQHSLENGLVPHWDADNPPSAKLALKLGFSEPEEYNGYYWLAPQEEE